MKLYYIANARMPSEKAHGIQIAKMCEAFRLCNVALTLIVPTRGQGSLKDAYELRDEVDVVRIPVWNMERLGPIGYRLTALQFIAGTLFYLFVRHLMNEEFSVYTVDMDAFSFTPFPVLKHPVFAEMHSPKHFSRLRAFFFSRAYTIATNRPIAEALTATFHLPEHRITIEPNGVDEAYLQDRISKEEARQKLGIAPHEQCAVYVGRVYAWKGLGILAEAAEQSEVPIYLVGTTREEYERITGVSAGKLRCMPSVPLSDVELWLSVADVLLLLGTRENENSFRYTSPMKTFEYLAMRRPVVFSRTPALESIVAPDSAYWYEPDDARSLCSAIDRAFTDKAQSEVVERGVALAERHTWRHRAERIMAFVKRSGQSSGARVVTPWSVALFVLLASVALFFSSYHLFDSPEPWIDEGLIAQSAIGLWKTGVASLPIAPNTFEPAWYITSGFPLTAPLAGAFALWGVSIETARLVMLGFLVVFFVLLSVYTRRAMKGWVAWAGVAFVIAFGPLYGHGRNVLGEVPGLIAILISVLPLCAQGPFTNRRAFVVGLGAGLSFATKPIFILFPAVLLLVLLIRRREVGSLRVYITGFIGALVPILVWTTTQFVSFDLQQVLSVYANPHELSVGSAMVENAIRLVTESQPAYFVLATLLWVASYVRRRTQKIRVPIAEEALLFFSVLVGLAYLRTTGYYRYFFPAQIFAVLYLPASIWHLVQGRRMRVVAGALVLLGIVGAFQAYQTAFRSWTATHYTSEVSRTLRSYFAEKSEPHFVYQAPEIYLFAYGLPLSQYELVTRSLIAGAQNLPLVTDGKAERLITKGDVYAEQGSTTLKGYRLERDLGAYVVLVPRSLRP